MASKHQNKKTREHLIIIIYVLKRSQTNSQTYKLVKALINSIKEKKYSM